MYRTERKMQVNKPEQHEAIQKRGICTNVPVKDTAQSIQLKWDIMMIINRKLSHLTLLWCSCLLGS